MGACRISPFLERILIAIDKSQLHDNLRLRTAEEVRSDCRITMSATHVCWQKGTNMKRILVAAILMLGVARGFAQTPKLDEKQAPTLQQRLEETCQAIKSGELANPQAQLADICRAYDDEQEKKKEQSKEQMQFWSAKFCGAPWAPDSPQRTKAAPIFQKLMPTFQRQYAGQSVTFLVVKSPIINAWTIVSDSRSLICMPTAMIDFLSSDGEVAFIMGHEMGHAVDQACKGPKNDMTVHRTCESRADAVGFDLLVKSGFSPYDAGAAFGKLEMYSGDIKTDLRAQLQALGRDHPMTPDRVQHMRDLLRQYNAVIKGPLSH
jgi:predicted Zn-dependent protease